MALLMMDDEDDTRKHFNYKKIVEQQNLSKKKKKLLMKKKELVEDDFQVMAHSWFWGSALLISIIFIVNINYFQDKFGGFISFSSLTLSEGEIYLFRELQAVFKK